MTISLYFITLAAFGVSLFKSKEKTMLALKKAWKSFVNIYLNFYTFSFKRALLREIRYLSNFETKKDLSTKQGSIFHLKSQIERGVICKNQ